MTSETPIKTKSISDDTDLRSIELKIGKNTILTPVKAIISNHFYKDTEYPMDLSQLHENFLNVNENTLARMNEDSLFSKEKNNELYKNWKKANQSPSFCIIQFKDRGDPGRYPYETEIDTMIDFAYSHSDITPIPSVPKMARLIDSDNFDTFLGYLENCYNNIEIKNKKKIMGYIPVVAPSFMRYIIDFYLDRGINAYYLDFDGTMVKSHLASLSAMKRQLAKRGYEEDYFAHYVNLSIGNAINNQGVRTARDILAYGQGLDSFGGIHMPPKKPKKFYDWLKTQKNISKNTNRLLNIDDYGYYILDNMGDEFYDIFPSNTLIDGDSIMESKENRKKNLTKIINLHQQNIETSNLKQIIDENCANTISYFQEKINVLDKDLKSLEKGKSF